MGASGLARNPEAPPLRVMYSSETQFCIADIKVLYEENDVFMGPDKDGRFVIVTPEVHQAFLLFGKGMTVGEVCLEFGLEPEHNELHEAIRDLESRGLINPHHDRPDAITDLGQTPTWTKALDIFGKFLFAPATLSLYLLLTLVAIVICIEDHSVIPRPSYLVFDHNRSLHLLLLVAISIITVAIHELGHMFAARALGVQSRFSLGHRLWVLVAETDLSGLWAIPRKSRYIPLLAGMIIDATSTAALICCAELFRLRGLEAARRFDHLILAIAFTYISRLIWQCFLFLRTDLYYVLSTMLRCTNLMHYTRQYVRHVVRHGWSSETAGYIPERDERVVRYYAWFWLLGQATALGIFVFVSVPVSFRYVSAGIATLRFHSRETTGTLLDSSLSIAMIMLPWTIGCVMWGKGLIQRRTWGA